MKLNKKDNIALMCEACIVREIEYTQRGKEPQAQQFKLLRKSIQNSKNLSFDDLKEAYSDSYSIKNFINQMETYRKSTLNREYYKKALEAAKKYYSSFENSEKEEFNHKLRNQFLNENRIDNLRLRSNRQHAKFISGATITALLAAGALALTHPSDNTKIQSTPTPIETENPTKTPESIQDTVTSIDNLDVNSNDFYDNIVKDFKTLYTEEYNSFNKEASISNDDIILKPNEFQNYIYKIKVGNEDRYISHGNQPQLIEQYFDNNHIKPEVIYDCESASVYSSDSNGNIQKAHDEFGNISEEKIDSAVKINGEYVKLYDGNNPKGLLNPKSNSKSLLADMGDIIYTFTLSTNTEKDRQAVKNQYLNNIKEYKESKLLYDCSVENQIDEQLIEDEGR